MHINSENFISDAEPYMSELIVAIDDTIATLYDEPCSMSKITGGIHEDFLKIQDQAIAVINYLNKEASGYVQKTAGVTQLGDPNEMYHAYGNHELGESMLKEIKDSYEWNVLATICEVLTESGKDIDAINEGRKRAVDSIENPMDDWDGGFD